MNLFKYRNFWMVAGVILFLPFMSHGQTPLNTVTVNAIVSETVALSVSPISLQKIVRVEAQSDVNVLTLTMSGSDPGVLTARVTVLIRSNTGYMISALAQSKSATLAKVAVLDARPTGKFTASNAIENLNIARELDYQTSNRTFQTTSLLQGLSSPLRILGGPRVSIAGTLNSPDNALEVTLLLTVKPDAGSDNWLLRLTLSGSASNPF